MPEKNSTDVTAGAKTIRLKMTTWGCARARVCEYAHAHARGQSSAFFSLDCEEDFLEMSGAGPAVSMGPGTWTLSMLALDHRPSAVYICLPPFQPAFSSVKYGWEQDLRRSSLGSGRHPGFRASSISAPAVSESPGSLNLPLLYGLHPLSS